MVVADTKSVGTTFTASTAQFIARYRHFLVTTYSLITSIGDKSPSDAINLVPTNSIESTSVDE